MQHFFIYDTYSGVLSSSSPSSSPSVSTSSSSPSASSVVSSVRTYDTPFNSSRPSSPVSKDPVGAGKTLLEGAHTGDLRGALSDYIALGIVTLIPWHQQLCDKAVYSDRWVETLYILHLLCCVALHCLAFHWIILYWFVRCIVSKLCFGVVWCGVLCCVESYYFSHTFVCASYHMSCLSATLIHLNEPIKLYARQA